MLTSTGIKNAIVQQYSTFTGYKNAFPAAAMFWEVVSTVS